MIMTDNNKGLILRQLMTYGTIIGVLTILTSLISNFLGGDSFSETNNGASSFMVFIMGFGIYFSLRHFSRKIINSNLSFGKYLAYGTIIGVFFSILYSAYLVVYIKFLNPETLTFFKDVLKEQYSGMGLPEAQSEFAINMASQPMFLFFSFFISYTFWTAFITLMFDIINLIIPKPKNN